MGTYVVRRTLQIVPSLLLITVLVFGLLQVIGGDPIVIMMGPSATSELIEQVRHELELDQPFYIRYPRWLGRVARGTSASRFGPVQGSEVVDRHTVAIHLTQPYQPFQLTSLGSVGGNVISKKAFEDMGREKFERNPVGAGPFELTEWKDGSEIVVTRFENYWQPGLPYLDRIEYYGHAVATNIPTPKGFVGYTNKVW